MSSQHLLWYHNILLLISKFYQREKCQDTLEFWDSDHDTLLNFYFSQFTHWTSSHSVNCDNSPFASCNTERERERERERETAVWTLESPFVVQLFVSHHWLNMQDHSFFSWQTNMLLFLSKQSMFFVFYLHPKFLVHHLTHVVL